MPITCRSCGQQQQELVFFCPTCGSRILECRPEEDTIVFTAGQWRSMRLVHYNGRTVEHVSGANLDFRGLTVTGDHGNAILPLAKLYEQLQSASELINL